MMLCLVTCTLFLFGLFSYRMNLSKLLNLGAVLPWLPRTHPTLHGGSRCLGWWPCPSQHPVSLYFSSLSRHNNKHLPTCQTRLQCYQGSRSILHPEFIPTAQGMIPLCLKDSLGSNGGNGSLRLHTYIRHQKHIFLEEYSRQVGLEMLQPSRSLSLSAKEFVESCPARLQPYLRLSRVDRPIGEIHWDGFLQSDWLLSFMVVFESY